MRDGRSGWSGVLAWSIRCVPSAGHRAGVSPKLKKAGHQAINLAKSIASRWVGSRQGKRHRPGVERLEPRRQFTAAFGTPDSSFGTGGYAYISESEVEDAALTKLVTGPGDDIYAGGTAGIARFTSSGAVDDKFGSGGLATLPGGTFVSEAVDSRGYVYALMTAAGTTILSRYLPNGQLQRSYGNRGTVLVTADTNFTPTCITIGSDDKPVIAGTEAIGRGLSAGSEMRVFRLNSDGSVDTTFGDNGSLAAYLGTTTPATPIIDDEVAGAEVLSDGDILIGGGSFSYTVVANTFSWAFGPASFAVARVTPAGRLDRSYGSGGVARIAFIDAEHLNATLGYPSDLRISGFDALPSGAASFAATQEFNSTVFAAAIKPSGAFAYATAIPDQSLYSASDPSVVALADGRSILLTIPPDDEEYLTDNDVVLTALSSDGALEQSVTTYNTSAGTAGLVGFDGASVTIAHSGALVVGGANLSRDGYTLEQMSQGSASVTPADDFANGTVNSLAAYNGQVDLAYYDSATHTLMFAQRSPSGLWSTPITVDGTSGAGEFISIAVDSKGNPAIAYYSKKSKSLKFAASTDDGQSFQITTLDASGNAGLYPSLQFDGTTPQLFYFDQAHDGLDYATTNSRHKWVTTSIANPIQVGAVATLPVSGSAPYVAYVDDTHHDITLAQQNSNGSWEFNVAATVPKGADSLAVANGIEGATIAFHDRATNDLDIAAFDPKHEDFSDQTIARDQGQFVAIVEADDGDATFAYSPASQSVVVYAAVGSYGNAIDRGGRWLTITDDGNFDNTAIAAYVDSKTGDLFVRSLSETGPDDPP